MRQVQLPDEPITGPLAVECTFTFSRPKTHFRSGKYSDRLKPKAPPHMTTTPDVDNVAKFYLDALNGKAFVDDRQIVRLQCEKKYGEADSVEIIIKSF